MTGREPQAAESDTSNPHPARMYGWFLGGKDNHPVDGQMAQQLLAPDTRGRDMARVNRAFMRRATRRLAENGVRQPLDTGSGVPTEPNLHQVAQRPVPTARVVHCDNDSIVLAHAAALPRSTPEGATEYIQTDAHRPGAILEAADGILGFGRPIALSRTTGDFAPDGAAKARAVYKARRMPLGPRSRAEFIPFFHGLELVDPGASLSAYRRPERGEVTEAPGEEPISGCAGVALKR